MVAILAKTMNEVLGGVVSFTEKLFALIDWPLTVEIPPNRPLPQRAAAAMYTLNFEVMMADEKRSNNSLELAGVRHIILACVARPLSVC